MLQIQTVEPGTFSLLKELSGLEVLSDFRLCGGTSLSLQIGHRVSVDLDFFGPVLADQFESILDTLNQIYEVEVNYRNQKVLSCYINGIKVDFVLYQYPWIEKPLYSDGITLCSINDIGAMKLEAIKGRGRKRDFTDLFFLLKRFKLDELLQFNIQKYKNHDQTLILKSLSYFEDAETDEDIKTLEKTTWNQIKSKLQAELKTFLKNL